MRKFTQMTFKLLDLLVIFMMVFGSATPALAAPSPTGATISSDLPDYNPGAIVTLTGVGWSSGESVDITVNDDAGQTWSLNSDPDPVADGTGAFTYQFQLPNWFVANYGVTATGTISGTATTTFTDGVLPSGNVQLTNWTTTGNQANSWITGTLNTTNSDYKEGETVPFRVEMGNQVTSSLNPVYAPICRDYFTTQNGGVYGYTTLQPFNTSRAADPGGTISSTSGAFSGVGISILQVFDPAGQSGTLDGNTFDCGSTQRLVIVKFNITGTGDKYLLFGGRLSAPGDTNPNVAFGHSSSNFPGGSLQVRLASPDKTAGINPGAIIQLAKLTVTKVVDSGSATPDQWCFTVTGPNGYNSTQCVPSGQSSVDFVALDTGSYTVTESNVPGYAFVSGSGTNCTFSGSTATAAVTAAAGGATNASCTFHNALQEGTLTVIKHVVNDNGGTATASQWSIHVQSGANEVSGSPQAGSESGTSYTLTGGTYTVSETGGPSGYTFDGFSGDCDSSGNVTVVAGQTKTCTLTNNDQTAHLKLVKTVTNDNGGTAVATDFTLSAAGPTPLSGAGGADSDVNAGSYTLSETTLPGYTAGSWSCTGGTFTSPDKIALALGQSATCTINNDDQNAHLTLVKTVTNDNGGTAVATDFTLSAAGPTPLSGAGGADSNVNAGSYTLSETNLPGYTAGSWSCSGGTFTAPDQIAVTLGQSATCTINNDDNAPALHLRKVVVNDNGGMAAATDWTLSATGPTSLTGNTPVDSGPTFKAGTYALSEAGPTGYTASVWVCVGGTQSDSNITVGLGESATCTISNDDNAAHLKLVKTVTNDNGGTAVATDFTLSAAGPTPISGAGGADSDVNAGTYTLSETNLPGYTAGSWSCVGGTQNGASISLALGQSATCTINNDDQTAHLKLVKTVTNDNGGTAVTTDFTLSAAGPTPLSGAGGAESDVNAGSYTLSETNLPGYTAGSWSCVGGTQSGSSVTLAVGQSATCTINNDDQTAHLKLVKTVTNDNGGTAVATDFTLSAAGPTPISGAGGAESDVNTGTYNLSETNVAGYTTGLWSCVGGTQSGSSVTLALGQSATCTINNDDIAPKLHLRKVVINDNGGTATVANFTLTADGAGTNDLSGTSPVDSGAGLKADTWALSETSVAGYAASAWSCVGGTQNGSNITVGIGGEATCTITNDDIAPKLHLRKVVVNDNGGTKTVADFTLTANGTGSNDLSGTSPVDSGAGLKADTWTLSETNVYGYTASTWVCVGGTQSGSNISVGIGGEATCTITNDDQPGTIVIKKITKPANTGSFSFTTTGLGYVGFTIPGGGQNSQTLNAGNYTVTESTQLGWILTGIGQDPADPNNPLACAVTGSGGSSGTGNLNTMSASITLKNGDTVTCVFENTGQGVTRTQGFWATHTPLANIAWFGGTAFGHTFPGVAGTTGIGDTTLCGRSIDTLGKLMGGFWSDVSKTSTGGKRSALDQARMQLLQQLLAAELNASAFGSVPSGGSGMFAQWESAYCGTNQNAIKTALQQAASFNTQGDNSTFTPGTSADSKNARSIADIKFWDKLP